MEELNRKLFDSVYDGDVNGVKAALDEGADVESRDDWFYENVTPLHIAAHRGNTEIVRILLKAGASCMSVNKIGFTALCLASSSLNTDVLKILLEAGSDPNHITESENSCVDLAARHGFKEGIKILIGAGADIHVLDIDKNTPLHTACLFNQLETTRCLLSHGADPNAKNKNGQVPKDLIKNYPKTRKGFWELFEEFNCNSQQALKRSYKWMIDSINEEQVFEKPDYGVKLVVPPSSVQDDSPSSVDTEVHVLSPDKSDIELPSNVELVSCLYSLQTSAQFVRPIQLYLQHNVDLKSQDDSRKLAFITTSGSAAPYKFQLSESEQHFKPQDNSGTILVSDVNFTAGIVWQREVDSPLSVCSYAVIPFYKFMIKSCWQFKIIITRNLGPFIERAKTDNSFYGWSCREPDTFYFNPDVNAVTLVEQNECYDLKSIKEPSKVTKDQVDQSQPNSALLYLHFNITIKDGQELKDLILAFNGMSVKTSMIIPYYELQQSNEAIGPNTSSNLTTAKIHVKDEILDKEPRKLHLMTILHSIKHQWNTIAEQLNVQYSDIKSAEYNVAYNDTRKLSEVLQVWIDKRPCTVSWRAILTVVEEPPVDNASIGHDMRTFLCRSDIYHLYCVDQSNCPVFPTFVPSNSIFMKDKAEPYVVTSHFTVEKEIITEDLKEPSTDSEPFATPENEENENDAASVLPIDEKISLTEVMTEIRALKSEVQELRSQFQDFIKHQQNTPTVCVRVEGATVQSSFVNTAASISDKSTQ